MKSTRHPNKIILLAMVIVMYGLGFQGTGLANPVTATHETAEPTTGQKFASGALTMLYFPVKTAYAGLGGIVGGLAYVLTGGDMERAEIVWTPTMKGTYVITPEQLWGDKPIEFFGKPESEIPDRKLSRREKRLQ